MADLRRAGALRLGALLAACALAPLAPSAGPAFAQTFSPSPYAVAVDLPACDAAQPDVAIIDSVDDWARVNDPALRVFCVRPGDYRAAGTIRLERSGAAASPRVLRYEGPPGAPTSHPVQQAVEQRAMIRSLELWGVSHWTVEGLTLQGADIYGLRLESAHQNLLDRLLIQRAEGALVRVRGTSSRNVLQNSVIRRAKVLLGGDRACVLFEDPGPGRRQSLNRLVQNEIYDCTDGIQLYLPDGASDGGSFSGLVIDENDIYLTSARRSDCAGELDPAGACACAEEAIDVKNGGDGPAREARVTISNNRIWGWLEGDRGASGDKSDACGGSGSWGGGIQVHFRGRHLAILRNRILDASRGVTLGLTSRDVIVRENLLHGIDRGVTQSSHAVSVGGPDHEVRRNTVVESGSWLLFTSDDPRAEATCNVVVGSGGVAGSSGGAGSVVDWNAYHASPRGLGNGANDLSFAGLGNAGSEVCFARRRWTSAETVCVPHAGPSPQASRPSACGPEPPAAPALLP